MRLILNDNVVYANATIDNIYGVLDRFKYSNSIVILEDEIKKNYIQLLCSKSSGIAEIRIYGNDGFVHLRAYSENNLSEDMVVLKTTNYEMNAKNKFQ